tara:strand:+ start:3357 stop:4133 length:777 start_codon:yes stop_codon:yes gene_type:complete
MGELGEKFGTDWKCQKSSVREALKLIDCQVDGFKEYLTECHEKNIQFSIQNGDDFIEEFEELGLQGIVKDTLIVTPVPAGSGKGLGKLIAGLLLIAAMLFIPGTAGLFTSGGAAGTTINLGIAGGGTITTGTSAFSALATGGSLNFAGLAVTAIGASLALHGIAEMTAPDAGDMESDPAFLFNSANSNIEQGQPVPVLYGRLKIGGTPISQGFEPGAISNTGDVDTDGEDPESVYGDSNATTAFEHVMKASKGKGQGR